VYNRVNMANRHTRYYKYTFTQWRVRTSNIFPREANFTTFQSH